MSEPSVRRTQTHFPAAEERLLFRRSWLPAEAERVLLVVHGYAEHSGRYEGLGSWFAARGVAVHAFDHQGHGRSVGPRCYVRRFSDLLDDLQHVLDRVRSEHAGIPVTLVGHSMGGLVTAAFLEERRPAIETAVLSGPALALGPGVNRARVLGAKLMRFVLPRLAIGSGFDPDGLSRDPDVVRRYLDDPLVFRNMTTSLAAALLDAIPRAAARAGDVRVPVFVLHGGDDPVCDPAGSRAFFEGLQQPGSDLRVYPKLRHEIFNEPEREQIYQDILDWLGERER